MGRRRSRTGKLGTMMGERRLADANAHRKNADHAAAAGTHLEVLELMAEESLLPWEAARVPRADSRRPSPIHPRTCSRALTRIDLGGLGLATEGEKVTRLAVAKLLADLADDGRVMTLAKEAIAAGQTGAAAATLDGLLARSPEHAAALPLQPTLG